MLKKVNRYPLHRNLSTGSYWHISLEIREMIQELILDSLSFCSDIREFIALHCFFYEINLDLLYFTRKGIFIFLNA